MYVVINMIIKFEIGFIYLFKKKEQKIYLFKKKEKKKKKDD